MHKKLKKYIESYDSVKNCITHELRPNGGMIVLTNQNTKCDVLIGDKTYPLESFQAIHNRATFNNKKFTL